MPQPGGGEWALVRRDPDADRGIPGDTLRVRATGRARSVPRRHRRAAVPARPDADAASTGRDTRIGGGRRVWRVSRLRRAARRAHGACNHPGLDADVFRTGDIRISVGTYARPVVDPSAGCLGSGRVGTAIATRCRGDGGRVTIHLLGVCGTAMATLAALLKAKGFNVQGSDEHVYPPMSEFLGRRAFIFPISRRKPRWKHRPGGRRKRDLAEPGLEEVLDRKPATAPARSDPRHFLVARRSSSPAPRKT